MRCILNTAYFVSSRLTAVVGLKFYGEKLEPIIGLVSGQEEIIFTPLEWIRLMVAKREMDLYFLGLTSSELDLNFPNIEIFFANHGEKQIVFRSTKTWSYVRLLEWELSKLYNLSACIENYVQKISSKKSFANFKYSEITENISQLFKDKPSFNSEIISMELSNYYPDDQISRELLCVYSDILTREIEKRVKERERCAIVDSLCEGFDVPF